VKDALEDLSIGSGQRRRKIGDVGDLSAIW
jgi:hypothetical protein